MHYTDTFLDSESHLRKLHQSSKHEGLHKQYTSDKLKQSAFKFLSSSSSDKELILLVDKLLIHKLDIGI